MKNTRHTEINSAFPSYIVDFISDINSYYIDRILNFGVYNNRVAKIDEIPISSMDIGCDTLKEDFENYIDKLEDSYDRISLLINLIRPDFKDKMNLILEVTSLYTSDTITPYDLSLSFTFILLKSYLDELDLTQFNIESTTIFDNIDYNNELIDIVIIKMKNNEMNVSNTFPLVSRLPQIAETLATLDQKDFHIKRIIKSAFFEKHYSRFPFEEGLHEFRIEFNGDSFYNSEIAFCIFTEIETPTIDDIFNSIVKYLKFYNSIFLEKYNEICISNLKYQYVTPELYIEDIPTEVIERIKEVVYPDITLNLDLYKYIANRIYVDSKFFSRIPKYVYINLISKITEF